MSEKRDLHVMISFDMESDIGSWTSNHEGVSKATGPLLELLDRNHVHSTFFYTGDAARACPDSLKAVKLAGHEIGCHTLHHESMGDPLVDMPVPPVLSEEVHNRLAKATDLLENLTGVRPVSFRAPRGWASAEMMVALDDLGYLVDSSYMNWYFREHFIPYHPSADDWTKPGDLGILEVPLLCDASVAKGDGSERDVDQWPKLRTQGGDRFAKMILDVAELLWQQGKPAVACLYLHPWEFIAMPPVIETDEARIEFVEILWKNTGATALKELDTLIGALREAGATYHTLLDFRNVWVNEIQLRGAKR